MYPCLYSPTWQRPVGHCNFVENTFAHIRAGVFGHEVYECRGYRAVGVRLLYELQGSHCMNPHHWNLEGHTLYFPVDHYCHGNMWLCFLIALATGRIALTTCGCAFLLPWQQVLVLTPLPCSYTCTPIMVLALTLSWSLFNIARLIFCSRSWPTVQPSSAAPSMSLASSWHTRNLENRKQCMNQDW